MDLEEFEKIAIRYFVQKSLDIVVEKLDGFRRRVFHPENDKPGENTDPTHTFPSVCLIGLGRCGSNIALNVSSLVAGAMRELEKHSLLPSNFPAHAEQAGDDLWKTAARWAR